LVQLNYLQIVLVNAMSDSMVNKIVNKPIHTTSTKCQ
jgi:hypothetical protein